MMQSGTTGDEPAASPVQADGEATTARAVVDAHGMVTGWSEGARRLVGYHASEVAGRPAAVLLADELPAATLRSIVELRRWNGTVNLRHRDGHLVPVSLLAHRRMQGPSGDGDGHEWLLVSPVARSHAEPDEDGLLGWSLTQSPCTMALYDTGLRLLRVNADMERVMGLSEAEMRGLRVSEIVLDAESDRTEHLMRRVLETGERQHLRATLQLAGSQRESLWSVSLAPVRDPDGTVQGVLLSAHNMTDEHLARQRLALIAEAGVRIGTTLDLARTAQELADVAVGQLADFVTVDLLPDIDDDQELRATTLADPVMLRRVANQSVLPGCPEAVVALGTVAVYPATSPAAECLASGQPSIHQVTRAGMARWANEAPDRAERMRRFGFHSVLAVPMRARGITLGVATFSRHRRADPFEQDDLLLAAEITARAALSIDNARRYTRERTTALTLQSSLLPQRLPRQPAVEVASRYLPASAQVGVGGDWFDVIPLSGARVALVVGDVVGHGIQASASMGRLRTAVRTLADVDLPPDELMTHLDDLVNRLSAEAGEPPGSAADIGATCLYAVYDPVSRRCCLARAGHPAPVLLTPGSEPQLLDLPAGPPLGLGGLPFESTEIELPEGSLLALYTDGLIEERGRDLDDGIDALLQVLARAGPSLESTCDTVLQALLPDRAADDVALLLARTHALDSAHVAAWDVPPEPSAVADIRGRVGRQLQEWGLGDAIFVTELLVSELVTNAIRHAEPPIELRLILDRHLICEVTDASSTAPHLRRARVYDEGGRGLLLVAQLSRSWGTRHTHRGKTIWAEQALPTG
ncbi:SpoIIE family protein phosphatase [Streptomyces sp. S.PNR 29]|uniref:SpoIIE family protein phosphatase n=1 Tax=Streptomyces sp. S.PNR 29 TaxID=2973805 RepID=UPI0025B1C5A9|nr:SpoIIE family protein phosphatase [Streptomyces sp. S.PNR 29]MDN0197792.1 SpoIIE family protein phosphatase [Streptomyces sp. S.PNR 29]